MENESEVIDMLPPGKALNVLIWERVFNKKSLLDLDLDFSMLGGLFAPFFHGLVSVSDFSISDLEVMFVVQAVVQKSDSIEFHSASILDGEGNRIAWAQFFDTDTGIKPEAIGETLAHAICLAALKFVGLGDSVDDGIFPGRKVYAVRLEDPPYLEEGMITRWHENGSDVVVDFTPKYRPSYISIVTRLALENGAVAFTPEAAIKWATSVQAIVINSANYDALQASKQLAAIKALGK